MTYVNVILADTPVAYWRGTDLSGTTLTDASGNGHNATLSGTYTLGGASPLISPDAAARFIHYGGGSVSIPNSLAYNGGAFTLETIVKADSGIGAGNQSILTFGNRAILRRIGSTSDTVNGIGYINGGGSTVTVTDSAVPVGAGNLVLLHLVYDGTTLRLYANASLQAPALMASDNNASGGNLISGGGGTFFIGSQAETAYYNYALDQNHITTHYLAMLGEFPVNMAANFASGSTILAAIRAISPLAMSLSSGSAMVTAFRSVTPFSVALASGLAISIDFKSVTAFSATLATGSSFSAATISTSRFSALFPGGSTLTVASASTITQVSVLFPGNESLAVNIIPTIPVPDVSATLAGAPSTSGGFSDGAGAAAQFNNPAGIIIDANSNIFISDYFNHAIRMIVPGQLVTTIAGNGSPGFANGIGSSAQFNYPIGITTDGGGNLYVVDSSNHRIRKVTIAGVVTTIAGSGSPGYLDGNGASAQFNLPYGITIDAAGNLYVTDNSTRIRKIDLAGNVTTIAGNWFDPANPPYGYLDGLGTAALFDFPSGIISDGPGNLYVADTVNNRIRKIDTTGNVTTVAGGTAGYVDGVGAAAKFYYPSGITMDTAGNLFVADNNGQRIRKVVIATGTVTTVSGSGSIGAVDGLGLSAKFNHPVSLTIDASGNLYLSDLGNNSIRVIAGPN